MKLLLRFALLVAFTFSLALPAANAETVARLKLAANGQLDLSAYKGKVVYLDFWASWCTPCRQSFPWMNKMHDLYSDSGLVIIAVNLDTEYSAAKKFLQQVPARFNIAYDPKGLSAEAYGLKGMPSAYLIDHQGKLVHAEIGFQSSKARQMEARIKQLLNNPLVASR